MDLALEGIPMAQPPKSTGVSILVFMDLALEGPEGRYSSRPSQGVSILVFMDLALEEQGDHRLMEFWAFQSLFLWILLSKQSSKRSPILGIRFQSLFLWILLSKQGAKIMGTHEVLFQSLFLWILLSKSINGIAWGDA